MNPTIFGIIFGVISVIIQAIQGSTHHIQTLSGIGLTIAGVGFAAAGPSLFPPKNS